MSHSLILYKDFLNKYLSLNSHTLPKIEKIVVSFGLGLDGSDKKLFDSAMKEMMAITGSKPAFSRARKSISNFKLREGQVIGSYVTLRKKKMYEFIDRLVYLALPRVHDFRGFKVSSFDKNNNFSFGIPDHLIFSELSYDTVAKSRGLNVSFHISARNRDEASDMLNSLMIPVK